MLKCRGEVPVVVMKGGRRQREGKHFGDEGLLLASLVVVSLVACCVLFSICSRSQTLDLLRCQDKLRYICIHLNQT